MQRIKSYIPRQIKDKIKSSLKLKENSSQLTIYPDDTFLVAYPKSGSTWLGYLLANYLSNNQCDMVTRNFWIPDLHVHKDWSKIQRPRYIKSHKPFTSEYPKVVYLVRDPRSVAVSYYFHCRKFYQISKNLSFKEYLHKFNDGSLNDFLSWNEHVLSWVNNSTYNFLLVKYEDLQENTRQEFLKILNFLNLDIEENKIAKAIERSSFSNMKKEWDQNENTNQRLLNSDHNISFIRKGKNDEWKDFFDSDLMKQFVIVNKNAMKQLNYLS